MVAPNEEPSCNSSSKYPTIGRSKVSDVRTPNAGLVQNQNPDFNVVRLQTILESIQRMASEDSPLIALAQQGAEAANLILAERSADNPPREPSIGNQDRARRAQNDATSSVSGNRRLADNDIRRRITQNHNMQEYDCGRDDLRNVIEDRRHIRSRTPTPPRRSLVGDVVVVKRSGFRALAGPLREVRWPDKFKAGNIDQYDGPTNPEELIQVYQMVIEAVGGDDRVKTNFLPMTLTSAARSWLINLSKGSINS
jgi:hypothetical protein